MMRLTKLLSKSRVGLFAALTVISGGLATVAAAPATDPGSSTADDAAPRKSGGLPEGPGKALVERVCTGCHSLSYVTDKRDTPEGWSRTVDTMIGRGANASPQEAETIVKYLSENLSGAPQ